MPRPDCYGFRKDRQEVNTEVNTERAARGSRAAGLTTTAKCAEIQPVCVRGIQQSSISPSGQPLKKFRVVRRENAHPAAEKKLPPPRSRFPGETAVWLLGCLFAFAFSGHGQVAAPTEHQLKAAFVYNFVKFVEWPPQAFAGPKSPLVVGVLGKNVFGDSLEQDISNKVIQSHPLQFRVVRSVTEATNCQVLFINASEKSHFATILTALRRHSVLTVSETNGFIEAGGIINFVIVDRKVRFQINNAAALQAGLKISSNLLSLAVPSS